VVVSKILATGDAAKREAAAASVVVLATVVGGAAWRGSGRRALEAANSASGLSPSAAEFEDQLDTYQLEELETVYRALAALGGEAAADYAFDEATDTSLPLKRRLLAVDLAENLLRSGAKRHAEQIPALARKLRRAEKDESRIDCGT